MIEINNDDRLLIIQALEILIEDIENDMINFKYSGGQIENLENGDVFIHEQHAYWNKWQDTPPNSVDIIIDGHKYKVK